MVRPILFGLGLLACSAGVHSQCDPIFTEHFDTDDAWTHTGYGDVSIEAGQAVWDHVQNGHYDFYNADLPSALDNASFHAEFKFTVEDNPPSEGPGACLFALCAGFLSFRNYDGSMGYALTPQDGLGVVLTSTSPTDADQNNWYLQIDEKDGANLYANSGDINLSSDVDTYYAVFERTSPTSLALSVYLDAEHTQLFGSATKTIHDSVVGLNTVQFGNHTPGNTARRFTGSLDDIMICKWGTDGIATASSTAPGLQVRTALDHTTILLQGAEKGLLQVRDVLGRLVESTTLSSSKGAVLALTPGCYIASWQNQSMRTAVKFVQP